MKHIYLALFLSLLVVNTICEASSFMKNTQVNGLAKRQGDITPPEPEPKVYSGYCFMKMKNQFYDLNNFNSIRPWKIKGKGNAQLTFNFCTNVDSSCRENDALAVTTGNCKRYAGKSDEEKVWTLSTVKNEKVITVKYPPGDTCAPNKRYQTTIELTCDPKVNEVKVTNGKDFDFAKCENTIKMRSKWGKNFIPLLYYKAL